MKSRALRRYQRIRLLRRRRHYWGHGTVAWSELVPPSIVDTPKRCSCWMCGNPRRYQKHPLTIQEIKFLQGERDEC